MNVETVREYCLSKKGATESFPFDDVSLVIKVMNKMFALIDLEGANSIALKCDPEKAIELREHYASKELIISTRNTGTASASTVMQMINL